jgi:tetratricopeptide (TPR) repeat protein
VRLSACLIAAALLGGCTAHRPHADGPSVEALESYIARVRQLSASARPPRSNSVGTLENRDPGLRTARALLTMAPTAEHHRLVGEAYARLGVGDAAYDQFAAALRLDPRDAASYDGLARVWRDWGYPSLGLPDAYRAIFYAPASPVPRNTLGTLLLNMGRAADARAAFERALALDADAAYVLNNLCYVALMQGDNARAFDRCRAALRLQPDLKSARNNLALAYAATGDWAAASREFAWSAAPAAVRYNMGVALMATRRYGEAARAFDEAVALEPALTQARARAKQARSLAARFPLEGSQ